MYANFLNTTSFEKVLRELGKEILGSPVEK